MLITWILIGVPGAGKSTWVKNQKTDNTIILSTDDIIEKLAIEQNLSYSESFKINYKLANKEMNQRLIYAVDNKINIIWDQTNIYCKARLKKLSKIPDTYKKIAVVFKTPDTSELINRLNNRPNKVISIGIALNMANNLEYPTLSEGFNEIIAI